MTEDKGSKQNPQLTQSNSDSIHEHNEKVQIEPMTAVSYRLNNERKKERKIDDVDKRQHPETPINRPKRTHDKKLKKGNDKRHKNIEKRKKNTKMRIELIQTLLHLNFWMSVKSV